jgi:hypothetical protein
MVITYIPYHAPRHKDQEYVCFIGKDLNSFQSIYRHLPFKGDGTTPYGKDLHTI